MLQSAVYYSDGRLEKDVELSPQQFLLERSAGVYTTALITPERLVIDWSLHKKRLARGIELLNTRPSRPFQVLFETLEAQSSSLAAFFERYVVPAVREALAAYYNREDASKAASQQHAMLLVCVSPPTAPLQLPQPAASSPAPGAALTPTASEAAPVAAGIGSGQGHGTRDAGERDQWTGASGQEGQKAATSSAGAAALPVSIAVYCKAVQPPPYGPEHAVQAAVLGRPRDLPGAKACSWVEERRQYEGHLRPPEAAEVLLSDASGRILEGLVTNFCVITTVASTATTTSGVPDGECPTMAAVPHESASPQLMPSAAADATSAPGGLLTPAVAGFKPFAAPRSSCVGGSLPLPPAVLHVCGPGADAALPGVTQTRVVEAARLLGLQVVLEPPHASERGTWTEAFITNCIKRIQPLSRVFCPAGNLWEMEPWDCVLPHPAGPYTTALRRGLDGVEERTRWDLL